MKVNEVLLNFKPDEDKFDNQLYEDIVDDALRKSDYLNTEDGSSSDDEQALVIPQQ